MNLSNLVIDGIEIPWSLNFGWIREICKKEIQEISEKIRQGLKGRLDSCPKFIFSITEISAEEKVVNEAADILEYSLKGKYLADKTERLVYWRIAIEKDETYEIFIGSSLSNFLPPVEIVAEKILLQYLERIKEK